MLLRTLRRPHRPHFQSLNVLFTRSYESTGSQFRSLQVETDSVGVPVHPTWSVDKLLSTYSKPVITPSTLKHLHELSALIPPDEGTEAHARLTFEMENLVKLVEAVKLVNVDTDSHVIPDGRVWAEGAGIDLSEDIMEGVEDEINGRELLRYAQRTSSEGLYLVDSDRPK